MDKHIEYFETKQEYLAKENELPRPSVSYTEDTKEVFYKGNTSIESLRMWLDDFPNEAQETHELEDFVDDPETCGSNPYVYSGDTFEYEGEEYYLWRYDGEWSASTDKPYALTTSNDFSTLYQESLESDLQNIDAFNSLYAYFWEGKAYVVNGEENFNGTLVKVERVE